MKHVKICCFEKLGVWLCCGLSNAEQPRVRLTYVCVCVGSFLPLYVSCQCPGLPHRLSDHRKDMGGRSQAYRCTQRKRKVMCAQHKRSVLSMWAARYVLHVFVWFRSVYLIKVYASSGYLCHSLLSKNILYCFCKKVSYAYQGYIWFKKNEMVKCYNCK